jgi:glycerol-3-phosphate dehydrogenase (NAD(P)+)
VIKNKSHGLVTLIGPSFAQEVFNEEPTIVNAVSANINCAKKVSQLFNNSYFKCVEITDEIGAEILGALKNVMAIAMGIAYQLHTSINTRAAMLAQATKEIFHIMRLYHGNDVTLMQFCGIGDIFLTCTDDKSRNFSFGKQIAKKGIARTLKANHQTVEGYTTTVTIYHFIKQHHLSTPLFKAVYEVLYLNKNPKFFVKSVISEIIE